MHACNHGTASHALAPGYATTSTPTPIPAPSPPSVPVSTRSPSPPVLYPVTVPPGCYPIELVQFWRNEYKYGQPFPLHWALFVRTVPPRSTCVSPHGSTHSRTLKSKSTARWGNFYELVGSQATYTAQSLHNVTFEPDMVPDWRGTHVIGWVSPGELAVFEGVVRQVQVRRHRLDWRSQHWVYEVMTAVGGNYHGVFMDVMTFGGLQKHMGRLLDAWENGDI